jgi:hypothetical protein
MNRKLGKRKRRMIEKATGHNPGGDSDSGASSKQGGTEVPPAAVSGGNNDPKTDTIGAKAQRQSQGDHWSVKVLALIAAIGGFVAAIFTGLQWWVASDAEIVSNRAIVLSQNLRLVTYGGQIEGGDNPRWIIVPLIENVGATQTKNMRFHSVTGVGPGMANTESFLAWQKKIKKSDYSTVFIGPRATISGGFHRMGPVELKQIQDRIVFLKTMGIVKYWDIFDYPHLTEFCYSAVIHQVDWEKYPIGSPILADSIPCEKHNCADGECGPDWKQRVIQEAP